MLLLANIVNPLMALALYWAIKHYYGFERTDALLLVLIFQMASLLALTGRIFEMMRNHLGVKP